MKRRHFLSVAGLAVYAAWPGLRAEMSPDQPGYLLHYDPVKGFRPAEANLTRIFLQLAGSLECHGSPEPYFRHMMAEHRRIDAKYKAATGKEGSSRPAYFTDEYLERILRNWNKMTPVLALEPLCRESGRNMRLAIMGSWNMTVPELVAQEMALTPAEAATYRGFIEKTHFTKADFPVLDKFYKTGYDRLSEAGRVQMSRRVWRGTASPDKLAARLEKESGGTMILDLFREHQKKSLAYIEDATAPKANADTLQDALASRLKLEQFNLDVTGLDQMERDALIYSHAIRDGFKLRIDQVRKQAKTKEQADTIIDYLVGTVRQLAVMAQSEYEAALYEGVIDRKLPSARAR